VTADAVECEALVAWHEALDDDIAQATADVEAALSHAERTALVARDLLGPLLATKKFHSTNLVAPPHTFNGGGPHLTNGIAAPNLLDRLPLPPLPLGEP